MFPTTRYFYCRVCDHWFSSDSYFSQGAFTSEQADSRICRYCERDRECRLTGNCWMAGRPAADLLNAVHAWVCESMIFGSPEFLIAAGALMTAKAGVAELRAA